MKRGDTAQAPYGRVRILRDGKLAPLVVYLDGLFAGREARIERANLKVLNPPDKSGTAGCQCTDLSVPKASGGTAGTDPEGARP